MNKPSKNLDAPEVSSQPEVVEANKHGKGTLLAVLAALAVTGVAQEASAKEKTAPAPEVEAPNEPDGVSGGPRKRGDSYFDASQGVQDAYLIVKATRDGNVLDDAALVYGSPGTQVVLTGACDKNRPATVEKVTDTNRIAVLFGLAPEELDDNVLIIRAPKAKVDRGPDGRFKVSFEIPKLPPGKSSMKLFVDLTCDGTNNLVIAGAITNNPKAEALKAARGFGDDLEPKFPPEIRGILQQEKNVKTPQRPQEPKSPTQSKPENKKDDFKYAPSTRHGFGFRLHAGGTSIIKDGSVTPALGGSLEAQWNYAATKRFSLFVPARIGAIYGKEPLNLLDGTRGTDDRAKLFGALGLGGKVTLGIVRGVRFEIEAALEAMVSGSPRKVNEERQTQRAPYASFDLGGRVGLNAVFNNGFSLGLQGDYFQNVAQIHGPVNATYPHGGASLNVGYIRSGVRGK